MPVALDAVRYFGTQLSDNITETPEGYRICHNVVIARTGSQTYRVSEISDPDRLLADLSPDEQIELFRDPSEVFSPATIASFEGKTFTIEHPRTIDGSGLLTPDTDNDHHQGHIQNVREGKELLDSGDMPLLADIVVKGRDAIRAIDAGERELSCGYLYELARKGYLYVQRNIIGNHLALVPKGRAGHEARINDSALPSKEHPVKNIFKHILGIGLQSYAKDAKPEDLAEAIEEVRNSGRITPNDTDKLVSIGFTKDGVEIFRRATKDSVSGEEERAAASAANNGHDAAKAADRKRLHDALDRQLDSAENEEKNKSAEEDAAMDAIRDLFKAKDAEGHPADCDCAECKDKAKDAEPEVTESKDSEVVSPEPVLNASEVPQSQFDSAKLIIKALKPFIAKCNDPRLKKAFDTAVKSVEAATKRERPAGERPGSYVDFGDAARRLGKDGKLQESEAQRQAREMDDIYAKERESRSAAFRGAKK